MAKLFWIALAAVFSAAGCAGLSPENHAEADTAIIGVNVVDPATGRIAADRTILIAGGEILAVAETGAGRLPQDVEIIDGAGRYAVPGLWDSHVHAFADAEDAVNRALPLFIAHGVTHVRDMAANLDKLQTARTRLAAAPAAPAPHIIAAGPLLESRDLPWYGDVLLAVESPEAARRELPRLAEAGVDFFKAYGGLSANTYAAIHAEADRLGLSVDGHVPVGVGLQGAAEAGQRTIEHLDITTLQSCTDGAQDWMQRSISAKFQEGYDAYYALLMDFFAAVDWRRCAAAFETLAENGGYFTPTLVMELNDRSRVDESAIGYLTPQSAEWCRTVLANIETADEGAREAAYDELIAMFERVRRTGVLILAGTDTPNYCLAPGASLHWELDRLHEAGMSRAEALRAATVTPAAAFGFEGRFGRIAPGYEADIVLFDADPLEGPPGPPSGVYAQGRWYGADALVRIREAARAR